MRYSAEVHQLVAEIVEFEIQRLGSIKLMQCEPTVVMEFPNLVELMHRECQEELDAVQPSDHPHLLQTFAAEAGCLVGLEMGKRLAARHMPDVGILRRAADLYEQHTARAGVVPVQSEPVG